MNDFCSGFVAIVGLPNVGKSTLLNQILNEKLGIVTRKPGTTRTNILGILNKPKAQIVFYDTPGIERAKSRLDKILVEEVKTACASADIVLYMIDIASNFNQEIIKDFLSNMNVPIVLVLNKIDKFKDKTVLFEMMENFSKMDNIVEIVPISAQKNQNVSRLLDVLLKMLPVGPELYPPDILSDSDDVFFVSELIREQVYLNSYKEIPYSSAVRVNRFEMNSKKSLYEVEAVIFVEKESQKGILIGKNASKIKMIGESSRLEIENYLDSKVFLDLKVGVKENWRQKDSSLNELGYSN